MTDNFILNDKENKEEKDVKRSAAPAVVISLAVFLTFIVVGIGTVLILRCTLSFIGRKLEKEQTVYEIVSDKKAVKKKEVTVEYIDSLLKAQDQLITAREDLSGVLTVEEGRIPLLTKKGFSMSYNGYVKAGTNLANREIIVSDDVIVFCICEPWVTDCYVDAESVVFYDKKRAVFNWSKDSDITEALALAEDDMYRQAIEDGILQVAKDETEKLIEKLMDELADDYEIRIMWISNN